MAKYLIKTTEEHRADSELEVSELINAAKADGRYLLSKYSSVKKERKSKGEVIDEWYHVTLVKTFNDEKEPAEVVNVIYEVE